MIKEMQLFSIGGLLLFSVRTKPRSMVSFAGKALRYSRGISTFAENVLRNAKEVYEKGAEIMAKGSNINQIILAVSEHLDLQFLPCGYKGVDGVFAGSLATTTLLSRWMLPFRKEGGEISNDGAGYECLVL